MFVFDDSKAFRLLPPRLTLVETGRHHRYSGPSGGGDERPTIHPEAFAAADGLRLANPYASASVLQAEWHVLSEEALVKVFHERVHDHNVERLVVREERSK